MTTMEHIKPGDRVLVIIGSFEHSIATVERVTETQIILPNGSHYRRTDGDLVGSSIWNRVYITDLSDDDLAAIRRRQDAYLDTLAEALDAE